jgi:hypothetical protein
MFHLPFGLSRPPGAVSKTLMQLQPGLQYADVAAALLLNPNGSNGAVQKAPN